MFHIRLKAVERQKIPDQRISRCHRALNYCSARQAHEVQVVGMIGEVVGRRAVIEVGMGDHTHLLKGFEVSIDR
jgi:hypothetical protein